MGIMMGLQRLDSEMLFDLEDGAADGKSAMSGLGIQLEAAARTLKQQAASSGTSAEEQQGSASSSLYSMVDSEPQPLARKAQSMAAGYRRPGFVPPHLQVMETSSPLGQSLPVNRGAVSASINIPFRPGSVTQGKGRKLAGLEMARFREAIMRQTGFIEPDAC